MDVQVKYSKLGIKNSFERFILKFYNLLSLEFYEVIFNKSYFFYSFSKHLENKIMLKMKSRKRKKNFVE